MTGADPTPRPTLDEAWKEAEAALPSGWEFDGIGGGLSGGWSASASRWVGRDTFQSVEEEADSPSAALRKLVARLRMVRGDVLPPKRGLLLDLAARFRGQK